MILNSPFISGSLTVTGNTILSGSITSLAGIAGTASYATNAEMLDGLDSTSFLNTSSFNTVSSSFSSRVANTEATASAYVASSGSFSTRTTNAENYIASINARTGSYATTGSNYFIGTQVITGSVYIANDLIVQGSSSLQNITASAVSIGTNTVILNTDTPAVRFAGISVSDSGSNSSVTSSIWYDSLNNKWIYQNESGSSYSGGMFISGPRNTGSLGSEAGMDSGYITKGLGGDHIGPSIIFESGSTNIGIGRSAAEFTLDVNGDIALNRTNKLMFAGGVAGDRSRSYLTGDGNNNIFVYGPSSNVIVTFAYTGYTSLNGILDFAGSSVITSASDKFAMGVSGSSYAWIQSFGGRSLVLQGAGNHVLIGQTVASGNSNGIYLRPGIESGFIVTSDVALQLSRLGTTGTIQTFYSGTTRVGQISVAASSISLESNSSGGLAITSAGAGIFTNYAFADAFGATGNNTMSSWGASPVRPIIEGREGNAISNYIGLPESYYTSNAYYSGTAWIRKSANASINMVISGYNNNFLVQSGASGSAGGIISFNTLFYINGSNGQIGVNTNSPQSQFVVAKTGNNATLELNLNNNGYSRIFSYDRTVGTSTNLILQDPGGNVGIGTTSPSAKLHVRHDGNGTTSTYSGIHIENSNASVGSNVAARLSFSGDGNASMAGIIEQRRDGADSFWMRTLAGYSASGIIYIQSQTNGVYLAKDATSWTSNSDERLKTDLTPIENSLDKVNQLRSVTGRYLTDDETKRRSFLIAQDVLEVLPEAINVDINNGMYGVQYTDVIPLLVASIKELSTKNTTLEARLAALESAQ